MTVELPKDAEGREIPLDTALLYGKVSGEEHEAVEFLRTHRCADEGSAYRTVGDCPGCTRASRTLFGNDDALCNLDSSGPGMWQRLADLIDNRR